MTPLGDWVMQSEFKCGYDQLEDAHTHEQVLGLLALPLLSGIPTRVAALYFKNKKSPKYCCRFISNSRGQGKGKGSRSVVSDPQRPYGLQPTRASVPGIFQARVLEWGAIVFSLEEKTHNRVQ